MTIQDVERIFKVNFYGMFNITKPAAAAMKERGYGRIVNLSSVSAKGAAESSAARTIQPLKPGPRFCQEFFARICHAWYHQQQCMPGFDQYRYLEDIA